MWWYPSLPCVGKPLMVVVTVQGAPRDLRSFGGAVFFGSRYCPSYLYLFVGEGSWRSRSRVADELRAERAIYIISFSQIGKTGASLLYFLSVPDLSMCFRYTPNTMEQNPNPPSVHFRRLHLFPQVQTSSKVEWVLQVCLQRRRESGSKDRQ